MAKLIKRNYLRWDLETPLEPLRREVEHALAAYAAAVMSMDPSPEDRWIEVREAVDRLIDGAERLAGHRIKPRAL